MDILIFLGTVVAVLLVGFLGLKLFLNSNSRKRRAKYLPTPSDHRLKQKHTGRPHLRHQTFERKEFSDEIWKASRLKLNESSWQSSSFTADKILGDSELALEKREPEVSHGGSPAESNAPTGPFRKTSNVAGTKRKSG